MTNPNNDRRILTNIKRCKEMIAYHTYLRDAAVLSSDVEAQERTIKRSQEELEFYQNKLRHYVIKEKEKMK